MIDLGTKTKPNLFIQPDSTERIFTQDWWLDAVSPDSWYKKVFEYGDSKTMEYYFCTKSIFGMNYIHMPPFTQTMGPVLDTTEYDYSKRTATEIKLFEKIIQDLPRYLFFIQRFHYTIGNWLPFYWHGFNASVRYTYIIPDLSDLDDVFKNFSYAKKKNIKKSKNIVSVKHDLAADIFYNHHKNSLASSGKKIGYTFDLFSRIYSSCHNNNSGKTFYAADNNGDIHSAVFIVWDSNSAYFLISSVDPNFRKSESLTLLIWEAIKFCSSKTKQFDFEGSMIKSVEKSFRGFGTVQVPFFEISKLNIPILNKIKI